MTDMTPIECTLEQIAKIHWSIIHEPHDVVMDNTVIPIFKSSPVRIPTDAG